MTDKTITVTLKLNLDDLAAQFRAAADALSDRYAANEARQREEAAKPDPDPLDENDHRARLDAQGDPRYRNPGGCWHLDRDGCPGCVWTLDYLSMYYGPLTFAPDTSPSTQDDERNHL